MTRVPEAPLRPGRALLERGLGGPGPALPPTGPPITHLLLTGFGSLSDHQGWSPAALAWEGVPDSLPK